MTYMVNTVVNHHIVVAMKLKYCMTTCPMKWHGYNTFNMLLYPEW